MISFADFQFVQIDENLRSIDERILLNPSVSNVDLREKTSPICQSESQDPILLSCSIRIRIFVSLSFSSRLLRRMCSVVDRSECLVSIVSPEVTSRTEQLSRCFHFDFSHLLLKFFGTLKRKNISIYSSSSSWWNNCKENNTNFCILTAFGLNFSAVFIDLIESRSRLWLIFARGWGCVHHFIPPARPPSCRMPIPLVNQSLSRPICAWSSLSLLIVPVDGNENKNGQRCLFLPKCDGRESVWKKCRIVVICSICLMKFF